MSLDKIFKPIVNYELIRLGRANDGGYLVGKNSINKSEYLISMGLDLDWSFEEDFKRRNHATKVICFDDNLDKKFILKKIIIQIISIIYNQNYKYLISLIKSYFNFEIFVKTVEYQKKKITYGDVLKIQNNINNIFFKIDIEGAEYRILDELIKIKNKITGIVIEFHDFDLHQPKIENFINNIGLKLIHIHPNNFQGLDKFGNPYLVELTFEKEPVSLNEENTLPHKYDMKNNPDTEDIILTFKIN
jgi:hypothetical protein